MSKENFASSATDYFQNLNAIILNFLYFFNPFFSNIWSCESCECCGNIEKQCGSQMHRKKMLKEDKVWEFTPQLGAQIDMHHGALMH